jgi:trimeric autotransporter adhesin
MRWRAGAQIAFLLLAAHLAPVGLAQSGIITTYAGANPELAISQAIAVVSVAPDGTGGFYVSSSSYNDSRVYRVASDGRIAAAAGNGGQGFDGDGRAATSALLNKPWGLAVDGAGNLFIADAGNHRIRKVSPGGIISTVAGTGIPGFSGDGGPATAAQLNAAWGLALDSAGNLYIADTGNNVVRKVNPAGVISSVAGNGTGGFSGEGGPATSAQLAGPSGVAVDSAGSLFIADTGNQRVRKVTSDGIIVTAAGSGDYGFSGDGGPAVEARLNSPWDVAVDSTGNLFIADTWNHRIRKVTVSGVISTVAGSEQGFSGDGGPAVSARLNQPTAVKVDSGGLLIADAGNALVRKVSPAGTISTVAGGGVAGFGGDSGPATLAKLDGPLSVRLDSAGNLFIADHNNERVRKVTPGRVISTVAGGGSDPLGDGGAATSVWLNRPAGVAVDRAGNLFIVENRRHRVRKVTPGGVIGTVAGNGPTGFSGDGGPAISAGLFYPTAVAVDSAGNLYIADSENSRVRKVTPAGIISTVAGGGTDGLGNAGPATSATLKSPVGLALDSAGNLFIADAADSRIRKVTADGIISTTAGNGTSGFDGDGGLAISAALNGPAGVAVDHAGNLFIADSGNDRVRMVTVDGRISTVAGNGIRGFSGDGGPAVSAQLDRPADVELDEAGNLFIADFGNSRVRRVNLGTAVSAFFPQLAVGGGYSTLFTVTNTGPAPATGTLALTDQRGNPLSAGASLTDAYGAARPLPPGSSFDLTIPSGGTSFLLAADLGASGPVRSGWARLDSSGGSLTAVATYERARGGNLEASVGVLQSQPTQFATIPVTNDTAGNTQTAYAIANPGLESISVKLALAASDGTVIDDTVTITLGPAEQIAKYVWQDLARKDFKGSLVFRGQAGASFIAVALLDKQGLLTAIPLIPGKAPGIPN